MSKHFHDGNFQRAGAADSQSFFLFSSPNKNFFCIINFSSMQQEIIDPPLDIKIL